MRQREVGRPTPRQIEAGSAAGFGGLARQPGLRVVALKQVRRRTLIGFATVEFGALRIIDCPVHQYEGGKSWLALPSRPQLDEDGRHRRDPSGKLLYQPVIEWRDRAANQRFCQIIISEL